MINVVVCIGSSCHLKGSRQVVEQLQELINKNKLKDQINLSGTFCMGKCNGKGVSVKVDEEYFAVAPEEVKEFFTERVVTRL